MNGQSKVHNRNKRFLQKNYTIAVSNETLKNWKLDDMLVHLQASKLACHSFMDIGRRLLDQGQRTVYYSLQ